MLPSTAPVIRSFSTKSLSADYVYLNSGTRPPSKCEEREREIGILRQRPLERLIYSVGRRAQIHNRR
jgi:hypothetical protein